MTMASSNPLRVIVIYRPPPSTVNGLTFELFLTEFRSLLELINNDTSRVIIPGDFNIHIDVDSDTNSIKLLDLIGIFNLKQHVQQSTHVCNHTLDLIITRRDENEIIQSTSVVDPGISDHFAVNAKIRLEKPSHLRTEISYRKLKVYIL